MKKVDYRFKILYAIGIILIVIGHYGGGSPFEYIVPAYSFHVPLFAFASGYFYSRKSEDAVGKYIFKKFKSLIIPLMIWNILYAFLVYFLHKKGIPFGANLNLYDLFVDPFVSGHAYSYNLAAWFIAPLFFVQVLNVLIRKLVSKISKNTNEWVFTVIGFCIALIYCYLLSIGHNRGRIDLPILHTTYLFFFYQLGVLYKAKLEKYDTLPSIWLFLLLFIAKLIVMRFFDGKYPEVFLAFPVTTPNGLWQLFLPLIGICFCLRISRILEPSFKNSKVVNLIADNTFHIMMHHMLGFFIFKSILALIFDKYGVPAGFNFHMYKTVFYYIYTDSKMLRVGAVIFAIVFSIAFYYSYMGIFKLIKKAIKSKKHNIL